MKVHLEGMMRNFIYRHPFMLRVVKVVLGIRDLLFPVRGRDNKIEIQGNVTRLRKSIVGNHNVVQITNSNVDRATVRIRGNGNTLCIEDGCSIGKNCSFWLEGNNNKIRIGKHTSMTLRCHFNAQEHDTNIIVGEDCMFSNTIIVRTSDSHPIYNDEGIRINFPRDVIIGNHVWIAPNSVIMKGAVIGNGCIVGSHSMVNKTVPDNTLVVGMPARVVKENIRWTRENVLV